MTWLFPAATSDSQQVVFALPPERETADGDGGRGPVVALMRRVVRVVAWLAEPVVGAGARVAAAMWEGKRRPHALWQLTADRSFVPPQWEIFTQGPGLLLIHGTFSTPQAGFCGWLDTPAFEPIMARYGGRVLTLAHPSVSVSPTDNIDWLQTHIPPGQSFGGMMDIVCHSRGGLLARDLAARAGAPKINRVCQVGAPNLGTPLADARHWVTFLDSHTNCLTLLPDTASTILLEGLLCLVKILGTGVARGLPGLAAMDPEGEWLKAASEKAAGDARWFTIGANYEPAGAVAAGFASRLRDRAADAVTDAFFATDNDLVVPSDGCHNPGPPIVDSLRLSGAETNHCTYFASRHVHDALSTWLALA
jgi:hypothetical protein